VKLIFLMTHPIQYYIGWCRALAALPEVQLNVLYAFRQERLFDTGFKKQYKWDIDLYSGYNSSTGPAIAPFRGRFGWWLLLFPRPIFAAFRNDCVLMLGFTNLTGILLLLLKPLHRARIILRQDAADFQIRRKGFLAWLKRGIYRLLLKGVNVALTQGAQNSNYFEYYGVPRSRHVLTPVIVDEELYCLPTSAERDRLRAKYSLRPQQMVFIISGKFEPRKRVDFAIRAFSEHAKRNPDSLLWIVGSGELDGELRALVQELGMDARVVFHGFVLQQEMADLYKASDVLVHVARFDPWPLCILEGIRCGLAVVLSSSVGSVDDIVEQGITGFRFEESDSAELTKCLDAFCAEPGLAARLAGACRERLSEHKQETVIRSVLQACRS
jgi:glycosyltransferase involved in cell wall biosynthesis